MRPEYMYEWGTRTGSPMFTSCWAITYRQQKKSRLRKLADMIQGRVRL